jgi:hypothetical protein
MTETRHDYSAEPEDEAGNGHRSGAFLKGFVGGALISAGAVICARHMYAAIVRLRRELMDVNDSAAARYEQVTTQVGGAFDDLEQKARQVAEKAPRVVARTEGDVEERRIAREPETLAVQTH